MVFLFRKKYSKFYEQDLICVTTIQKINLSIYCEDFFEKIDFEKKITGE